MFSRHLEEALGKTVPAFMEAPVRALRNVVIAKRQLNAALMRTALVAAAVSPFKLIEGAEWTANMEQLGEICAQSGTQYRIPAPPVDYLSPEDREEGTKAALAYIEALEFDAFLMRAAVASLPGCGLQDPGYPIGSA